MDQTQTPHAFALLAGELEGHRPGHRLHWRGAQRNAVWKHNARAIEAGAARGTVVSGSVGRRWINQAVRARIDRLLLTTDLPMVAIAKRFGISPETVGQRAKILGLKAGKLNVSVISVERERKSLRSCS